MHILVTGGSGLVGTALKRYTKTHDMTFVSTSDYDLRDTIDTHAMIKDVRPDAILHLAAKVGGVKGNIDYVADYYYDNIMINTNVLNSAKNFKIPRVISVLSTCIYPDHTPYPLAPERIHDGRPHSSNFGYAYAKRMLDVHTRAIRQQYGLKYNTVVPNNLFGENDNFDLENSHVIPAIMRKVIEAKQKNKKVVLWGDGSPLREFTYSDDVARILLMLLESDIDFVTPLNIGNVGERSIKQIAEIICVAMDFKYKNIEWDIEKPTGQYRKPSTNEDFTHTFPDFTYTDISSAIEKTCQWLIREYPNVRGI